MFQRQNAQIPSDLNRPFLLFADRRSKFTTVKWNHPSQLRQPFPTKSYYQVFNNIVSTS
jgi:hypothetical protein